MKKLYLKRGKEESLLRFHPWVFSGAIAQADDDLKDGDLVRVLRLRAAQRVSYRIGLFGRKRRDLGTRGVSRHSRAPVARRSVSAPVRAGLLRARNLVRRARAIMRARGTQRGSVHASQRDSFRGRCVRRR